MSDKPTSFDIAALAGVSQPTVSRALRGDRAVSAATRQRIEAIARELNYVVDKRASSLRRGASSTLALLFFDDALPDGSLINPFFLSMLGSILRTCALRGYDLLTSFQNLSANWHVDFKDSHKADGLILLGYGSYSGYQPKLQQLVSQGTHFVRWGAVAGEALGVTIGCDNRAGGRIAGEHLLKQGRRRIAFLGETDGDHPEFRDRFLGLAAALEAGTRQLDPAIQGGPATTEPSGYIATKRLLASGARFDALFAASDMVAIGAMRALRENGRRIPQDVAVIGFDDIPAAGVASPPLTTIAQDFRLAGETLVNALIQIIDGQPVTPTLLPPALVARGSA